METVPILVIYNQHTPGCGDPPQIDNRAGNYLGYFENEHGEQWIFVYDHTAATATLYGGDIGWAEPVTAHKPDNLEDVAIMTQLNLVLGNAELAWLKACWMAAASAII